MSDYTPNVDLWPEDQIERAKSKKQSSLDICPACGRELQPQDTDVTPLETFTIPALKDSADGRGANF